MSKNFILLADIGGSNVRLALMPFDGASFAGGSSGTGSTGSASLSGGSHGGGSHGSEPLSGASFAEDLLLNSAPLATERRYPWSQMASLNDAIDALCADLSVAQSRIIGAVLALAGPVLPGQDLFQFTNIDRSFSKSALQTKLNSDQVYFINDYFAQAMVIPLVQAIPARLASIVPGQPNPMGALAVVGPGTGLGVAGLIPPNSVPGIKHHGAIVMPGEGGNVALGVKSPAMISLLPALYQAVDQRRRSTNDPDPSRALRAEDVLSGHGIQMLYAALEIQDGQTPTWRSPQEISAAAHRGDDPIATRAFALFFENLATCCAGLALQYLAVGGVYITGGITQKNLDLLDHDQFARVFTDTWHYQDYLSAIPVTVVTSEASGLAGAAAYAQNLFEQRRR